MPLKRSRPLIELFGRRGMWKFVKLSPEVTYRPGLVSLDLSAGATMCVKLVPQMVQLQWQCFDGNRVMCIVIPKWLALALISAAVVPVFGPVGLI